jgi:hypothetical protein
MSVWNENTRRSVRKEVQISASSEECYARTVLGYEVTAPWASSRKRCNNKQYMLQWECMMSWSQWFGVKACCFLTELISVLLLTLLKHYTEIGIYTIQLWPCSFGFQSPLKDCHFSSTHVLKEVMHIWLTAQLKRFLISTFNAGPVVSKRGLCYKTVDLWVTYCCCSHFNKYTVVTFWLTLVTSTIEELIRDKACMELAFTSTSKKNIVFWDITPCSPVEVHKHFGGPYCFHLQGQRVSQARMIRRKVEVKLWKLNAHGPRITWNSYYEKSLTKEMLQTSIRGESFYFILSLH